MDSESLRKAVEAIVIPEGRMIRTPGHAKARRDLVGRLKSIGGIEPTHPDGFELAYGDPDDDLANIMGRIPGRDPALSPLLIAAHYDTCGPLPGADDNAAAIAIVLGLIPRLVTLELDRSVLVAFFDGEEPPLFLTPSMGSIHWYRHQRTGPVHCAVVLDLMGHDFPLPGCEDLVAVMGMESDPGLGEVISGLKSTPGIRLIPTLNEYIGDLSDHHTFRKDERPYLFFSCAQWEHYHRATDTPEKLNYEKMAAFGELLACLIPRLCEKELTGPFEGYDSTPIELEFMDRHLGEWLKAAGFSVENRNDLTNLIAMLQGATGFGEH